MTIKNYFRNLLPRHFFKKIKGNSDGDKKKGYSVDYIVMGEKREVRIQEVQV